METVGKILSITLLTIFGAAGATVYLVDSSLLDSVINSSSTYTSEENDTQDYGNFSDISIFRESSETKYYEVEREREPADNGSENKAVWGQEYNASPSLSENSLSRASMLAKINSYETLQESMEHWNRLYREAVKSGKSTNADLAYKNYMEYKSAMDIKRSAVQQ